MRVNFIKNSCTLSVGFTAILKNLQKNVCEISKDTLENIHNLWKTRALHKKVCGNDRKLSRKLTRRNYEMQGLRFLKYLLWCNSQKYFKEI